jgi:hypothetical protein
MLIVATFVPAIPPLPETSCAGNVAAQIPSAITVAAMGATLARIHVHFTVSLLQAGRRQVSSGFS